MGGIEAQKSASDKKRQVPTNWLMMVNSAS